MKLHTSFLRWIKTFSKGVFYIALIFITPVTPFAAFGAKYYVSTTGSDNNPGTKSAPFLTLQKGFDDAFAGDTVIVANGTYKPTGNYTCGTICSQKGYSALLQVNKSGSSGAPITIMAQNKWGAVLDGGLPYGYSGDGTDGVKACDAAFNFLSNASYVTIRNFDITRDYWVGAMVNEGNNHDIRFIGNHFHNIGNRIYNVPSNTSSYGIVGVFGGTGASNITMDGNVFNNIGRLPHSPLVDDDYNHDHGIYIYNGPYTITNNIFYSQSAGWDIQTSPGSHDITVNNNTFLGGSNPQRDGAMILWGRNTNVMILNNIFYNGRNYAIDNYDFSPFNVSIFNNIIYGSSSGVISASGTKQNHNRLNTDPKFVNVNGHNYHLKQGSPAINTGVTPSIPVPIDLDGNARPFGGYYDVGAYEYGSAVNAGNISIKSNAEVP